MLLADALRAELVKQHQDPRGFVQNEGHSALPWYMWV